jgi:hypothetical protein
METIHLVKKGIYMKRESSFRYFIYDVFNWINFGTIILMTLFGVSMLQHAMIPIDT